MMAAPTAVNEARRDAHSPRGSVGGRQRSLYDRIAVYYDTIYAKKDYASECRFLHQVFRKCRRPVRRVLDLGCGTGTHAGILSGQSSVSTPSPLLVTGVDRSAPMLEKARMKFPHLDFRLGNVLTYRTPERYDAVIAMFGVLGHVRSEDLHRAFLTANYHLKTGGLFVFDGWHRPAVMRGQRPSGKLDRYESVGPSSFPLLKYVEMSYCAEEDIGSVEYVVVDLEHRVVIRDRHRVSLLTRERVEHLCRAAGFTLVSYGPQFALGRRPRACDWKVSVVLKKVVGVRRV
jgi:SAM-dependent methyltransferase